MMLAVLIGLAGALGAIARVLVDAAVRANTSSNLPRGTFAINVSGSLLLGLLIGLVGTGRLHPGIEAVLGIGFCGGYTTFSTATLETLSLARDRRPVSAIVYAAGTLTGCLTAAAAGFALGAL